MAQEVQVGTATVYGVAGTYTGYASVLTQSGKLSHKFDLSDIKDAGGYDATLIAKNERAEIDIDFNPTATTTGTNTRAGAAAKAVLLAPLAKVTLAAFAIAALNGDWIYIGDESIELSNEKPVKMTLKLRKYADATQNTLLTGTAISG